MSGEPKPMPESKSWQAEHLRLTVFPVDPVAAIERDWWQEALGQPAESSTKKKLLRWDQGVVREKAVSLTVDFQQMSWMIQPVFDPLNPPSDLPTLGLLAEGLRNWGELFDQVIACIPEVLRIGFGAVLLQPVQGLEAGYGLLDAYLPDVRVSPESSDFNYRINRKRPSKSGVEGLYINRLSTWSFLRWQIQARVGTKEEAPVRMAHQAEGFACRVELDINTPAERQGSLPKDRLRPIWSELVDLGLEIAARGDIP